MKRRIVLADDHAMFRQGLRSMLESQPGLAIVGEASTGRDAIEVVTQTQANTLVTDLVMPDLNGVETTRAVMTQNPQMKVIALSAHSNENYVGEVFQAGASGYVLKSAAVTELIEALRLVSKNGTYLSPGVTNLVVDRYVRNNGNGNGDSPYHSLTPREREVLQLVAEGYPTKEIAAMLSVSTKTVETHRQAVMRKLELRSVAHLTKFAVREGITALTY